MLYKIILLVLVAAVVSMHEANAQTAGVPANINQTSCTVFAFNNVENPFTLTLDHDPVLTESVSHTTTNPSAALQSIGTDPTQAQQSVNPKTHLSFSSNDTTNWTIVVTLNHPNDKNGPRTLLMNLYSKQTNLVSSNKVLYDGTTFCGIFQIQAVPPVHVQTNAEIIKLGQEYSNLTIGNFATQVHEYASRAESSGNNSGFIGVVMVIIMLIMGAMYRADKRNLHRQEENAKLATIGFKNATSYMNVARKHLKLEINDMITRHDETLGFVLEQFVTSANSTIRSIHNTLEDFALFTKTNKKEAIRIPEPPVEIFLPSVLPEEIPEIQNKDVLSTIPIIGKFIEKRSSAKKKLEGRAEFYYEEFMKNLDTKYKGKFQEMSDRLYPLAEKGDAEARAQVDAMYRIIEERGGWP